MNILPLNKQLSRTKINLKYTIDIYNNTNI